MENFISLDEDKPTNWLCQWIFWLCLTILRGGGRWGRGIYTKRDNIHPPIASSNWIKGFSFFRGYRKATAGCNGLKKLRNYNRKLCARRKNRRKHNQHFKLLFFTRDFHPITSNQISTFRKLNLPFSQAVFLFLPLEMQRRLKQTRVYYMLSLLCLKRNDPQTFKSSSCKSPFLQCVCCWCMLLLRWMFFIPCDN